MTIPPTRSNSKRIALVATNRYSANINDFYMFFKRSRHRISSILVPYSLSYKKNWVRNRLRDKARANIWDPFDFCHDPFVVWYQVDDLIQKLEHAGFDYIAMGNGTGVEQQALARHFGNEAILYSEYGWLPWSENFYISRQGCGNASEIASMTEIDIQGVPIDATGIKNVQHSLRPGRLVPHNDFVYVPLQKDINDFKFLSSPFSNNEEFLEMIDGLVPKDVKVLVKCHPLYRKSYDFSKYPRFVDISREDYSKSQLYRKMKAMICINSTSILEALCFGAKIFAYGRDIFTHKDVVHFRITDATEFAEKLESRDSLEASRRFVSLLLQRQICRRRCVKNDIDYIASHYWNNAL